jgi:hypothetical protein
LWQPLAYFGFGIAVILLGVKSYDTDPASELTNAGSLIERIVEWTYYTRLLVRSSPIHQLLGVGLVQNEALTQSFPMPIDNLPLALVLHIGLVGLILFGILMISMWLYLRRAALVDRQPFVVAAASLWASLACSGTFNMMLAPFGAVFALSILCERKPQTCGIAKIR